MLEAMSVIYCTATSLDGYIADDRESLSWLFATPNHEGDPEGRCGDSEQLDFEAFIANVGALVMGRSTLEWLRRELTKDGGEFVWPYAIPSWVVTHHEVEVPGGVHVFAGDVAELHPQLVEAAGGQDVWVVGGGDLAGQFADAGLLDTVWLHVCPVTLGTGKPLLPRRLRLRREALARDGQFTALKFSVIGPEVR